MRNTRRVKADFEATEIFGMFLRGGDFNLLKSFLDAHRGINATDEYGRTALINCINNYSNPIRKFPFANDYAKKLVASGIDINKEDFDGYVALHFCILSKNYEMLDFLLECPNINVHTQPDLLNFAISKDIKNHSLIIKLLKLGLDPFEKNEGGYSFMMFYKNLMRVKYKQGAGKSMLSQLWIL
jgi:ankyrin repeat protein